MFVLFKSDQKMLNASKSNGEMFLLLYFVVKSHKMSFEMQF